MRRLEDFQVPLCFRLSVDLCSPQAWCGGSPVLAPLCSPSSPCQVFCSSWVLIEMANSKDRACSQLRPSPLPGAGGRQQNPISVARAPLLYPAGRGPPVWPTWSGPEWLEPRPAEGRSPSLLPAPSQEAPDIPLPLPQDPVPNGRGQFSAKWSPGGPKAIRTPPPTAGVAIGVWEGRLPGPLPWLYLFALD